MEIRISDELRQICERIVLEDKSEAEWALIESCDMFQTEHFNGGFDADEQAFCFSYYDENESEFWFQMSLSEVADIISGKKSLLQVRTPD